MVPDHFFYQRVGTNCILGFFKLEGLELSKCESYTMSHTNKITHAADRVSSSMYSWSIIAAVSLSSRVGDSPRCA